MMMLITEETARNRLRNFTDLAELRQSTVDQLSTLASEIREFLIEKVSRTGGHLGSNLGIVELTIALHRTFHSPHDRILFDTGHQAYVHKILTGRQLDFDSLRQPSGLSGYPSRAESHHDVIENSHASTVLAYADGLAKAYALRGEHTRQVVAVLGDGALTGGMAWEALNNIAVAPHRPIIIVLNDNGRSYAPTVGAIAHHLTQLRHGENQHNFFTAMGLAYLGPIDGHSIFDLEQALNQAVSLHKPVVVHCITTKGKGYEPAESDQADCLHTVGAADPTTAHANLNPATWTSVLAKELVAIGAKRPDVVCLTAAMLQPTGLGPFAEAYPDRVFDVGLAEQHAVTSAAGLAMGGLHPIVAIYATFLNRAFDQLLMDVALHRLAVTFVLDRAGITGPDGPSHHGMWDLSLLSTVPGLRVAAPRDAKRLSELLSEAIEISNAPTALRFPKATVSSALPAIGRIGEIDLLRPADRRDVLLVSVGPLAASCLAAANLLANHGISATVVDPRWVVPVTTELIELAARHQLVVTVEDNVRTGGYGALLTNVLAEAGAATPIRCLGLPQAFIPHGKRSDLLRTNGLDDETIAAVVRNHFSGLSA